MLIKLQEETISFITVDNVISISYEGSAFYDSHKAHRSSRPLFFYDSVFKYENHLSAIASLRNTILVFCE